MTQVKIVMQYDVPEADRDDSDETGMTEAAYVKLHDELAQDGFDDITITKQSK